MTTAEVEETTVVEEETVEIGIEMATPITAITIGTVEVKAVTGTTTATGTITAVIITLLEQPTRNKIVRKTRTNP